MLAKWDPAPTTVLPVHAAQDYERDALRAAYRLVDNHEAVVKFALRGPGQPGPRPVSAPLADPTAIPATEFHREVDAGAGRQRHPEAYLRQMQLHRTAPIRFIALLAGQAMPGITDPCGH